MRGVSTTRYHATIDVRSSTRKASRPKAGRLATSSAFSKMSRACARSTSGSTRTGSCGGSSPPRARRAPRRVWPWSGRRPPSSSTSASTPRSRRLPPLRWWTRGMAARSREAVGRNEMDESRRDRRREHAAAGRVRPEMSSGGGRKSRPPAYTEPGAGSPIGPERSRCRSAESATACSTRCATGCTARFVCAGTS